MAEYQEWKLRIAENGGCNHTVAARLKGQRLGQTASLPVGGHATFVPTAIFGEVTNFWRPIMEARDPGCTPAFRALVDRLLPQGAWDVEPLTAAALAETAGAMRVGASPGYDNWAGADLR
eukprot:1164946-Amphidinium_carterae.1